MRRVGRARVRVGVWLLKGGKGGGGVGGGRGGGGEGEGVEMGKEVRSGRGSGGCGVRMWGENGCEGIIHVFSIFHHNFFFLSSIVFIFRIFDIQIPKRSSSACSN